VRLKRYGSRGAASIKGEFERKSILSKFETVSQVVFAGRIRSGSISVTTDDSADVIVS
jgi:hypothetical protein